MSSGGEGDKLSPLFNLYLKGISRYKFIAYIILIYKLIEIHIQMKRDEKHRKMISTIENIHS